MSHPYQTFASKGASDSRGKLKALRLDGLPNISKGERPFEGLSVLDIGCNEGFFSIEAHRLGASRVLGIDNNDRWLDRARSRSPKEIEYRKCSWWDIPEEEFDIIFFLSAIHYENNQKELLTALARSLTATGVLVLECGVCGGTSGYWMTVERGIGDKRRYPTKKLLVEGLLSEFSTRLIGPSVKQSGDPIPRFVFHCSAKKPTAFLVIGHPLAGKTSLCRQLEDKGIPSYSTDNFLRRAYDSEIVLGKKIQSSLKTRFTSKPLDLGEIGLFLIENYFDAMCDALTAELPIEFKEFSVEGHLLTDPGVHGLVRDFLKANGVRVWNVQS